MGNLSMSHDTVAGSTRSPPALIGRVIRMLDAVPYTVLALPLRAAVAVIFWNSAMAKLANWDTAIALFTARFVVPLFTQAPDVVAQCDLYLTVYSLYLVPFSLVCIANAAFRARTG